MKIEYLKKVSDFLTHGSTVVPDANTAEKALEYLAFTEGVKHWAEEPECPWHDVLTSPYNQRRHMARILFSESIRLTDATAVPSALSARQQITLAGIGINLEMLADIMKEEAPEETFYHWG